MANPPWELEESGSVNNAILADRERRLKRAISVPPT
jgi:hypothetical protein